MTSSDLAAPDTTEKRPTLLVVGDSLSYYGPKGGLPADHPQIWPNLVAAELGWNVELVARIGWTTRDAWWAMTQDPRVWAAIPHAGAVVLAVGGMDSLPSPLPTALRESMRYLRPAGLRRVVRNAYGWLQPRLSPLGRPVALPPRVSVEYLETIRESLAYMRPDLPLIGTLPSVHRSEQYRSVHRGRIPAVRAITRWASEKAVPLVDLGEAVRENIASDEANPDGIHWGWEGHRRVATEILDAVRMVHRGAGSTSDGLR